MRIRNGLGICVFVLLAIGHVEAFEYHGRVTFGGLPVPGATVTARQGANTISVITDPQGIYSFADVASGTWTIEVQMSGFSSSKKEVTVTTSDPGSDWELKMLSLEDMQAKPDRDLSPVVQDDTPTPTSGAFTNFEANELTQRAADGLLINGTANNGAASPFAQFAAFGNNRAGGRSLYNFNIGVILDNSALDARPFSLTGQNTAKPDYNRLQGVAAFAGPLKIGHLLRDGPNVIVNYQWSRNRDVSTESNRMPTSAERTGDLSQFPRLILDPTNSVPFPGNIIPTARISSQAKSLLTLYPLPNFDNGASYNYQVPIVGNTHQDSLQSRFNQRLPRRNQLFGNFAYQNTRTDSSNLFGFVDTLDSAGINTSVNWQHTFTPRLYSVVGYQFSRFSSRSTPFFDHRENVSGNAGILGNNQDSVNWGPPALTFSSGVAPLSDTQYSFTRNQTDAVSLEVGWGRRSHRFDFGGDIRRQQFNLLAQQDPRGTFTFTGATTGSDFAGFLLGIPDTSSIAFGNADKYFRSSFSDAYVTDDWRVRSGLTFNIGVRWEYVSPITELYGRVVNLDITPGFAAVTPVVASNPAGPLTGERYPNSLVRPDRNNIAPRIGFAWRPFSASSTIIRGGYGIYYDTSVYLSIATQMAQQAPLSTSLSVQNSAANPLTLANGFHVSASSATNTFAVDPRFRIGYSQNWQLSAQRDLPTSLVLTATYLGTKGTRGMEEFLPNTVPTGASNPCPSCPAGYAYVTSNANSTREAGQLQLRRRLHNGLTATAEYTFSKSIDNAAVLGGPGGFTAANSAHQKSASIAQNWLDLSGERSLSNFDQRHLLSTELRYTTGMGIGGGTLLSGWKGALAKEWTVATTISAGTGLPLTPVYLAAVQGTGVTGTIRPNYTGASIYAAPTGFHLNPAAYTAPLAGQWGNAGRDSITGPSQFSLSVSLARTFRFNDRLSLDLRVDAANALNNVTFAAWNTTVTSTQFGLPTSANAMRTLQTTLRLRF